MSLKRLAYLFLGHRTYSRVQRPKDGAITGEGPLGMEDFARALADFVRDHQAWAAPIVLVLALREWLAFISLLIPAWGAMEAVGALTGASGTPSCTIVIAAGYVDA